MIVSDSIEEHYKEYEAIRYKDDKVWKLLKNNKGYEVTDRGNIRKVGNLYPLYQNPITQTVRVFKGGVAYRVSGGEESEKVFGKKKVITRQRSKNKTKSYNKQTGIASRK